MLDKKSISDTYQFLDINLILWFNKKHNSMILFTTKAKYIAAESCYAQLLWIKQ